MTGSLEFMPRILFFEEIYMIYLNVRLCLMEVWTAYVILQPAILKLSN